MLLIVFINTVLIGVQTDKSTVMRAGAEYEVGLFLTCTGWYLTAFDNILLGVYVAEAILKLYAMRHRYFKDGWNVFGII